MKTLYKISAARAQPTTVLKAVRHNYGRRKGIAQEAMHKRDAKELLNFINMVIPNGTASIVARDLSKSWIAR